jgi:hypothetical protein
MRNLKEIYSEEIKKGLQRYKPVGVLTEEDIEHIPEPVKKYLRYTGVIGKGKLQNVRLKFTGKIKNKPGGKWMKFESEQYNFFDEPSRLFYIKSKLFGIPFTGLHKYVGEKATMEIKVASLIKVVDAKGPEMNKSETVTMFNDMCILAPASLIDKNIKWKVLSTSRVKATFVNQGNEISAILYFDKGGKLIDFSSDDRYMSSDGKKYLNYKWTTPVSEYIDYNGRKIFYSGKAIWHTTEGKYCYGEFYLKEVEYNCKEIK